MLSRSPQPVLAPPPAVDTASHSLFVDFDGTLVPLVDHPELVRADAELVELLTALHRRFAGRIALVSGRSIEQLDAMVGPIAAELALAGSHGAEVRRDGRLEEATWDEAFAEIDRRLPPLLEAHGRNAVAVYLGNPTVHVLSLALYSRVLLKALGTRNVFSASTVDQMPKHVSSGLMFGSMLSIPIPDVDRTDHLLILGANPLASNGSLMTAPVRACWSASSIVPS